LPRRSSIEGKANESALVLGGQGNAIAALAGRPTALLGLESFVDGVRGALLTGATLTLIGSAVAFVDLRRGRSAVVAAPSTYADKAAPARAAQPG
jgi:hypothetical protein